MKKGQRKEKQIEKRWLDRIRISKWVPKLKSSEKGFKCPDCSTYLSGYVVS